MAARQDAKKEHLLKLLMIGDMGTGKTCLIRQFVHSTFQATSRTTIGVDFALKTLPNGVTLQIWDIAGQERYGQMTRVYFQSAVGALVVADITKPETYEAAIKWKQDLDSKVFLPGTSKPIPALLLLNKCDLGESHLPEAHLDAFCKQNGFIGWKACSAKTAVNVPEAFTHLVGAVQDATRTGEEKKAEEAVSQPSQRSVKLGKQEQEKKKCPC